MLVAVAAKEDDLDNLESEYLLETNNIPQNLPPEALSHLSEAQATQIEHLLQEFPDVVGGQLGRTTITKHTVNVGDAFPIRQHPY